VQHLATLGSISPFERRATVRRFAELVQLREGKGSRRPSRLERLAPDQHSSMGVARSLLAVREVAGRAACTKTDPDRSRYFPPSPHARHFDNHPVDGVNSALPFTRYRKPSNHTCCCGELFPTGIRSRAPWRIRAIGWRNFSLKGARSSRGGGVSLPPIAWPLQSVRRSKALPASAIPRLPL
jgi:hypothetical protein